MAPLNPEKLHTTNSIDPKIVLPRRYTLTHSDSTGEIYLTVAHDYDLKQISGLYTRIMRDEILAEWQNLDGVLSLHVYCYISGGLVLGSAGMREKIFKREMPLILEAIRYGDSNLFEKNPELDKSTIILHFQKSGKDYKIETFGTPSNFINK